MFIQRQYVVPLLLIAVFLGALFYPSSKSRFATVARFSDFKSFPSQEVPRSGPVFNWVVRDDTFATSYRQPLNLLRQHSLALVVIVDDTLVYEQYAPGYSRQSIFPSFSIAKSFVSTLVGIAVADGLIRHVDDPITDYLPELDVKSFGSITIEHLLNMQSGLDYSEAYDDSESDITRDYFSEDLSNILETLRIAEPPGLHFKYVSINTQLLGMILARVSGMPLEKYLSESLWQPLGMNHDATWSVDNERNKQVKAFCCINAEILDFAHLGRLYLQNGRWKYRQIVPKSWVRRSSELGKGSDIWHYGYHWWRNDRVISTTQLVPNDYYSSGYGGQYLYISPVNQMILVIMSSENTGTFNHIDAITELSRELSNKRH